MVLEVIYAVLSSAIPSGYYLPAAIVTVALIVVYAFAQGRTTTRERDLHARVVLVTGGFTPLGLTLISALASRGAHIIALSPYSLEHPYPSLIIPLLRSTTNNEKIFVEHADLSDASSIRQFCTRFLTGNETRLDAIVFAHEYQAIGSLFGLGRFRGKEYSEAALQKRRETNSLATFLITTLLLPVLLVAPVERDIRIVNVVNPFYAATAPAFGSQFTSPESSTPPTSSTFYQEGFRSLRTSVLTRHLQRVLDSLPNHATDKKESGSQTTPNDAGLVPSNIISVSVCPGVSRRDTIAPLLYSTDLDTEAGYTKLGLLLYVLLFPIIFVTTKHAKAAVESVLHVLFLPTPLKRAIAHLNATVNPSSSSDGSVPKPDERSVPEEVLKPGALYRECAVVQLKVFSPPEIDQVRDEKKSKRQNSKKTQDLKASDGEDATTLADDGEFGGEQLGRIVWEWYENRLKVWEAESNAKDTGTSSLKDADLDSVSRS